MYKIIMAFLEIEIAELDYKIEINNYECNKLEKPTKDFISRHHYYTDKITTIKEIQQKITSIWEGL